ncbi:MAG: VanZ family protein [Betaproteobacteria bacterium]|nr:VanZ family protein [Betaproteobacteria bacterium]
MYVVLTAYASLYPLSGWRDRGVPPFEYLVAPWPRAPGLFDVAVNVAGYMPYGLLCMAALYPRLTGVAALAVSVASGTMLSILMEAAQNYLPTRFSSNVDVASNAVGAALGALLGLRLVPWLMEHGPFRRLRAAIFLPGVGVDVGLVLIGLWLFTQLNPTTLLFGTGDLRDLVAAPSGPPRPAEFFASVEALTAAANLVSIALLVSALAAPGQPVRMLFAGVAAAALCVKALTFALMRADAFAWMTPGAQDGLVAGLVIALAAVSLPRVARLGLAAVLVMAATVLVNLVPHNPYFSATLRVWHQGHFFNFNGLTRLVCAAWPFAVLAYVVFLASRRRREGEA